MTRLTICSERADEPRRHRVSSATSSAPSRSPGSEEAVVERIRKEMQKLDYDEVMIDGFGNILGRIGTGKHHVAIDSHIDTVDVGDPSLWKVDPFAAEMKDGIIYGRGASDQKGGMAAATYAGHLIKKLGLAPDFTVWVVGSVFEEDCDGLCWQYILKNKVIEPDAVIITEPTNLQVYRGHRGRMEIEVTTRGLSCHGSAPERGVNAVYKMAPIVEGIEKLHPHAQARRLPRQGQRHHLARSAPPRRRCARSPTPAPSTSTAASPRARTRRSPWREVREVAGPEAEMKVLEFDTPELEEVRLPDQEVLPDLAARGEPSALPARARDARSMFGKKAEAGKWVFSTNGIATMGMFGIPTVGFGPANEQYAHSPNDQCPAEHIPQAVTFYAHLLNRAGRSSRSRSVCAGHHGRGRDCGRLRLCTFALVSSSRRVFAVDI